MHQVFFPLNSVATEAEVNYYRSEGKRWMNKATAAATAAATTKAMIKYCDKCVRTFRKIIGV